MHDAIISRHCLFICKRNTLLGLRVSGVILIFEYPINFIEYVQTELIFYIWENSIIKIVFKLTISFDISSNILENIFGK